MKNVYLNEFKRSILPFIILNVISIFALSFIVWGFNTTVASQIVTISGFMLTVIILFYIVFSFSYNKKIKTADYYYSLPISKRKLFLGKYLFVLTEIVATIFIFTIFIYIFVLLGKSGLNYSGRKTDVDSMQYVYLIKDLLMQLLFSIIFFNFVLYFYYNSNSYFDGFVYIMIAMFLPWIIACDISLIIDKSGSFKYANSYSNNLFVSILPIYDAQKFIHMEIDKYYTFNIILYSVYFIISIILFILLFINTKNSYAENVERIDNKLFGYISFIPLIALSIALSLAITTPDSYFFVSFGFIFSIIGQYILFMMKNKSFKISKKEIIELSATSLLCLIILVAL